MPAAFLLRARSGPAAERLGARARRGLAELAGSLEVEDRLGDVALAEMRAAALVVRLRVARHHSQVPVPDVDAVVPAALPAEDPVGIEVRREVRGVQVH